MLTPAQQSAIDYHLRETNLLTNEELILELTDHYTTALEERLAQGITFEIALTDVQLAFGGRKGLQKMERQYNRVTFRHYDETWKQALHSQFRRPLLWQTLLAFAFIVAFSWQIHKPYPAEEIKWTNFLNGSFEGALLGSVVIWLGMLWPYLKSIPSRGLHNIPTEVLYLLKRHSQFLLPFYATGSIGHAFLFVVPDSVQIGLTSLYLLIYYLFIRTSRFIYETLYDVDTAR